MPSQEQIRSFVKGLKRAHTIGPADSFVMAMASESIIHEFLDAIEPVLIHEATAMGEIAGEEMQRLFDVYASWDRYNHGRRKISAQILEDAREND
jgi:hypothetical protein